LLHLVIQLTLLLWFKKRYCKKCLWETYIF